MERTIKVRQSGRTAHTLPQKLPEVFGYVAVADCSKIGEMLYLRPKGGKIWYRFLIVDCASKIDRRISDGLSGYQWMKQKGVIVELDYNSYLKFFGTRLKTRATVETGIPYKSTKQWAREFNFIRSEKEFSHEARFK